MKIFSSVVAASILVMGVVTMIVSCESEQQKEERIAKAVCSSCHLFPEPGLLDKATWATGVLPEMKFRMGMDPMRPWPHGQGLESVIRTQPMISDIEWDQINKYYARNAPDSLTQPIQKKTLSLDQFEAIAVKINNDLPFISLVQADTVNHTIYVGTRWAALYILNDKFVAKDSFHLHSPPSHIVAEKDHSLKITSMGIMDPNDEAAGTIVELDVEHRRARDLIDSIKRPVYFEKADFNGDNREDYLVCAFGNFAGELQLYENLGDQKFRKHVLQALPGARTAAIRDVNGDGRPDIIMLFTQAREEIVLFTNKGNFEFDSRSLLRFPAVYGSSYFELADFNHDGKEDILYANGDNLDYSSIFKPYHGIHIFTNDGNFNYKESFFHPMYGASKAMARDYDGDGDLDIAAISFFPDFARHPDQGFVYLESNGKEFIPHTTPLAATGRWLVMDAADLDQDGDCDVILGALDFRVMNPDIMRVWQKERTQLLVLRNNRFH